jgi:hypothetical protein
MTAITHNDAAAAPRRTSSTAVARALALATAVLFVLHGVAHAVGFADVFGLSDPKTGQDGYTLVGGLDPDGVAMYALGVLWLVPIALYLVAAAGLILRRAWWFVWALAATLVSLAACILWLEPAKVGLVLNVVILVGVARRRPA